MVTVPMMHCGKLTLDQPLSPHRASDLAAKEPDVSLESWWGPNLELKEKGTMDLDSSDGLEDQIWMKDDFALFANNFTTSRR